jgi:hypothetical protein
VKKLKLSLTAASLLTAGLYAWGKYHWDISSAEAVASPLELDDNLTSVSLPYD